MSTDSFELHEATVSSLQARMTSGELTARSVVDLYLERIAQLNRVGPDLRAIIETNPDAQQIATGLDQERAENGPRGPLHGIPVVLKDNIDTHDALTTTAGSLALEGSVPSHDAFIVAKLRHAGAIILAKANMSEWAYFRGEHATSGWSARGGQCRNPYVLDRNPCGSSSGSAVAVAANMAALAIGTETDGSIMCPSSINGIVGIKPTVGLCSRTGIIPISHSQDTAGPMTRTVEDAAILLGALTGVDSADPATARSRNQTRTDYASSLDREALRSARIGVVRTIAFAPETAAMFEVACDQIKAAGAEVVDVELDPTSWKDPLALVVLEYEFKHNLNAYLQRLGPDAPVKTLADVIEFNDQHPQRELSHFGQQRMVAAQARGPLTDTAYLDAVATVQRANREGIDTAMDTNLLDAIIAPTTDPAWLTDHENGDRQGSGSSAGPAAIAGYPNISVPMGQAGELPVGMSFFGRAWSEPTLIKIAYAFEQLTTHRTPPAFAPSNL